MGNKGRSIGTIFAEIDLDSSSYTKKQKEILQGAKYTSLDIEKNWRTIGSSSDKMYEAMKQNILNAYNQIANSAKSSAQDIIRAEEAKNAKIKQINEKQYGQQTSLISKLQNNWMAASAAIVSTYYTIKRGIDALSDVVLTAARFETLGIVMRVVGNNAGYTGAQMEDFAKGLEKTGISMTGSRESLIRMTQAHLDLAESSKLARIAQDAAVIGNINSSEAFQRMVYGIQSAQVEMLRTIGINVNFENSYQAVAKETGRVATSFSETEKAAIRMNAVLQAGEAIAGTYEAAIGTAGKQLFSLERHFENLKVLAGAAFTPALAEIVETITGAVVDLNGELSGKSKKAIEDWGINFRISIIQVEAEITRIAMFLDKIGGSLTTVQMLLTGPGHALGIDSSTKRFEAAAKANMMYEQRYKDSEKALQALADKQVKLEEKLMGVSNASAKAAEDAAERKRLAAGLDAKTEAAKAAVAAEAAEAAKKLDPIRERLAEQTAKNNLTEIQFIEYTASQYLKKGLSQVEVDKWKSSEIEKINQKEADKILKIQQDANMAIAKHRESATKEYEKLLTNETDFALTENERQIAQIERQELDKLWKLNVMLQEETITWEQYEKAKNAVTANAAKARLTNETENARRIASINYGLVQDIIGMEETAFELRMGMIEAEKNKYIADGGDIVYAAKWAANQQTKALINLGKRADDVAGGMRAAFSQMYLDQISLGQASYDITMGFYGATTNSFSSMLYDMKDGMSSFSDYWDVFTDSLWKVFADMTAKMVTQWLWAMATMSESSSGLFGGGGFSLGSIISGGISLTSSIFAPATLPATLTGSVGIPALANYVPGIFPHEGGVVGETYIPSHRVNPAVFINAPRLHSGLASDEFPAILQKGETVIPKGKAATYYITIPITIHGSVISEHELARKLVPKINKAVKEGVH